MQNLKIKLIVMNFLLKSSTGLQQRSWFPILCASGVAVVSRTSA